MQVCKWAVSAVLTFWLACASGAVAQEAASGAWSKKAPMRHARNELQAAAVNGKIYAIGGGYTEMKDGKPSDNITSGYTEEYDPGTDTWRERAPMPEGGTHNGIAVLDGKIYIAGGFAGNRHTLPQAALYSYQPAQFLSVSSGAKVVLDTLPEGSVVTLNKGTAIHYRRQFAGTSRQVEMEGEAFFSVTADKNKPFVVNTNGVSITVLGTSFNVRTDGGKTEVVVETGRVEVRAGDRTLRVEAHERALITNDNLTPKKESNPDQLYNYYRTNAFECNGTPLWRLAEKLNEVYKVHIVIDSERLRNLPLTTTFVDESLDGILGVVSKTFAIRIVRNGQEIMLK